MASKSVKPNGGLKRTARYVDFVLCTVDKMHILASDAEAFRSNVHSGNKKAMNHEMSKFYIKDRSA